MWGDIAIAFMLAFITTFVITPYTIELAKKIGTTKTTLSRYENGEKSPKLQLVGLLANYFQVDMSWLSGQSDQRISFNILPIYTQLSPPRQQKVYDFANQELEEQKQEQAKDAKTPVIPIENNEKDSGEIYTFAAHSDDPDKTYTDEEISEIEAFLDKVKADYDKKHNK